MVFIFFNFKGAIFQKNSNICSSFEAVIANENKRKIDTNNLAAEG